MKSRHLLAMLFCLAAAHGNASTVNFMGNDYQVVISEGISWGGALTAAQAIGEGWSLASVGTAEENTFLESLLNPALAERSHFWIGGTDAVTDGTWRWVDGSEWSFTDWWAGEPNNWGGDEDFLGYDLRGGAWAWNDENEARGFVRGFIAERSQLSEVADVSAVPLPGALPLMLSGLGVLWATGRRRKRSTA